MENVNNFQIQSAGLAETFCKFDYEAETFRKCLVAIRS